jgi:hypothetical protein
MLGGIGSGQIGGVGSEQNGRRLKPSLGRLADTRFVSVGHIGQRVNGGADQVLQAYSAESAASVERALARSTSNSTMTSSRSLSAPKKPL